MRLSLVVLWTLFCSLTLPLAVVWGLGDRARRMRANAHCIRLWARGLLRVLGVRLSIEGQVPRPGQFLVSNHVSWIDVIVISSVYPMNWVAKKEVSQIPVMGWLTARAGILFIDQERKRDTQRISELLRGYLAAGLSFSIFAEGYCGDGRSLLPFRGPLFAAPAELGVDCVPTAIHYDLPDVVWNDGSAISQHARRVFRAKARRGGPLRARLRFAAPLSGSDRKQLKAAVEAEVQSLFQPMG